MSRRLTRALLAPVFTLACVSSIACVGTIDSDDETLNDTSKSEAAFQAFLAKTYKEPWENGVYIVDGDTPIESLKLLREFFDRLHTPGGLIVQRNGSVDAAWSSTQKRNLTYCVSDRFGTNKARVVQGMADAAAAWEAAADIKYVYRPDQDANCTASNTNVLFDVNPVNANGSYLARAFFPGQSRGTRNVLIDGSAFRSSGSFSLVGILRHELGHTLGFRHEHTRPEAGRCFEDNNWRALTPYDRQSVMHYPQCNGANTGLVLTASDKAGVAALYGPPGSGGGTPNPEPPPPPAETTRTFTGSVARGENDPFGPFPVTAGSVFRASITGTGDPDLYVRFGSAPTTTAYACRPYLDGPNESCEIDVPAGATNAFVSVRGFAAGTYTLTVRYR
jgi:hypothetical protein